MASRRRGRPQSELTQEGSANFMDALRKIACAMREQAAAAH